MLKPANKFLVVKPIEEHIRESGVLIPDNVKIDESTHKTVELLVPNENTPWPRGTKLLAPAHVLEEVSFSGEKYYLLLENYVMGYEII